jgi:hypothetical protein
VGVCSGWDDSAWEPLIIGLRKCYAVGPLENMMKRLFSTVVATVVIIASASAQQPTQVKVDGKDYTVTEMPGRTMHMVQLSGPEGTAMVMVNNQNQITMYSNPPGGGSFKSLIDQVWDAYLKVKSGDAAANNNAAPAGGTSSDPNAALRAQADAVTQQALQRVGAGSGIPQERKVEFDETGAAIVTDPDLNGKVRIATEVIKGNGDEVAAGLLFTVIVDPGHGAPPETETWIYKGGLEPAGEGKKLGHGVKGTMEAALNSQNTRAAAGVDICGNLDNCFSIIAKNGGHETRNEIGGYDASTYAAYSGRDPKHDMEVRKAHALSLDLAAAKSAIASGNTGGKTPKLDFTSDRFNREEAALDRIVGKAGYTPTAP